MRNALCVILLLALAIPVVAQVNEWHATGVVQYCFLERLENKDAIAFVEFQVGGNTPILCIFEGGHAQDIYAAYRIHNDHKLKIELVGRLRITPFRAYVKVRDFGIKCER